jgi:hypothetical protein
LLAVDPAGEEENDERERRRHLVHGASVPEGLPRCKARQIRQRTPSGWAEFRGHQACFDSSNRRSVERSGLGRVFAQDGVARSWDAWCDNVPEIKSRELMLGQ